MNHQDVSKNERYTGFPACARIDHLRKAPNAARTRFPVWAGEPIIADRIANSTPNSSFTTPRCLAVPRLQVASEHGLVSQEAVFRILYFVLHWRLTRLDFPAAMTLPPQSP